MTHNNTHNFSAFVRTGNTRTGGSTSCRCFSGGPDDSISPSLIGDGFYSGIECRPTDDPDMIRAASRILATMRKRDRTPNNTNPLETVSVGDLLGYLGVYLARLGLDWDSAGDTSCRCNRCRGKGTLPSKDPTKPRTCGKCSGVGSFSVRYRAVDWARSQISEFVRRSPSILASTLQRTSLPHNMIGRAENRAAGSVDDRADIIRTARRLRLVIAGGSPSEIHSALNEYRTVRRDLLHKYIRNHARRNRTNHESTGRRDRAWFESLRISRRVGENPPDRKAERLDSVRFARMFGDRQDYKALTDIRALVRNRRMAVRGSFVPNQNPTKAISTPTIPPMPEIPLVARTKTERAAIRARYGIDAFGRKIPA